MATWSKDELATIGRADELQIAPRRIDESLRTRVTIWVVRVGDDLYVRSYKGRDGAWFRAVKARHDGHIRAGGVEKDVNFVEETDLGVNDQIDVAYRTKYRRSSSYVPPMISPEERATTLRLMPHATSA
jgi:hypothetical protein